jgi:hypothetical protein
VTGPGLDYRPMAFALETERLKLRLRSRDDASCNLALLGEREGGTTLGIDDVEDRLDNQAAQAGETVYLVLEA